MCDTVSTGRNLGLATVAVQRNTFTAPRAIQLLVGQPAVRLRWRAAHNVFDVEHLITTVPQAMVRGPRALTATQMRRMITTLLEWDENENAYRDGLTFLSRGAWRAAEPMENAVATLDEWSALWNLPQSGSVSRQV